MKRIVLASNNNHKLKEFREIFADFEVLGLKDIGFVDEIIEDGCSFEENSAIKAKAIQKFLAEQRIVADVIADDSGLCVDALGGEPGIFSARYSGEHDDKANRDKLLRILASEENRKAHFVCCLVLLKSNGEKIVAEGRTHGEITRKEHGDTSFGYDCLFYSTELQKTFGEATAEEKNEVSHRGRAIKELLLRTKI